MNDWQVQKLKELKELSLPMVAEELRRMLCCLKTMPKRLLS